MMETAPEAAERASGASVDDYEVDNVVVMVPFPTSIGIC